MSLWCPEIVPSRASRGMREAVSLACALSLAAAGSRAALAAQVWVQPEVSVDASSNTNVELAPTGQPKVSGASYGGETSALFSIATPDSLTNIKPRIRYDYYPSETDLNTLEAYLDFNSVLTQPRDRYSIYGDYGRISDLSAQLPAPQFNPVNPQSPTPATTGQVAAGSVSNVLILVPDYVHDVTPLTHFELTGTYQGMRFSPSDTVSHVNFNYGLLKAAYGWTLTPRSSLSFAGFGSTYRAGNIDSTANSGGAELDFAHNWTPILRTTLALTYQYTKTDQRTPVVYKNSDNAIGFSLETTYQLQTDQLRATLDRSLLPSSSGGLYETDEARVQYIHHFSELVVGNGAAVYLRTRDIGSSTPVDNRDYAAADVSLEWRFTQTVYIEGGYSFAWQKYLGVSGNATNNSFYVHLGYRGLPRPQ
jgi:hypothetical protein